MISKFDRLMLECNDTLSQSCNDIIIDTKVEWAKNKPPYPSGVLELCQIKNILSLGSFIFKLRKDSRVVGSCGNWDGINTRGSFVRLVILPHQLNGDTSG